jgi:predicted O-methyltransferase YrrM
MSARRGGAPRSSLHSPAVVRVLDRLHTQAHREDPLAKERVRACEAERAERLDQEARYELYGDAPLAIKREVGALLYLLTLSKRPRLVVEFGASLGLSTIYLAAALSDLGGGSLITTELRESKATLASHNLAEAQLDDLVELRVGDARETLRNLPVQLDLLFLDGRNDLYVDILRTVQPSLAPGALVVADLSAGDVDLLPYLERVRDPTGCYVSAHVPLDEGVELSVRAPD